MATMTGARPPGPGRRPAFRPARRQAFVGLLATSGLLPGPPVRADAGSSPPLQRASRTLMGTQVSIVVAARPSPRLDEAVAAAFEAMNALDGMMSHYRSTSVVAALERAAGRHALEVPPPVMQVLIAARAVAEGSDGDFDPTVGAFAGWRFDAHGQRQRHVPEAATLARERQLVSFRDLVLEPRSGRARLRRAGMRLDLGGIAKLPILQAGLDVLHGHGMHDVLIDGGGDVLASGHPHGRRWRVGLRDPRAPQTLLGSIDLDEGVLAASGTYERGFDRDGRRYHHVLDPRSGQPTDGLRGVFLLGRSVQAVNGLGVAAMVAGPTRGMPMLRALRSVDTLAVASTGAVAMTGSMARRLRVAGG